MTTTGKGRRYLATVAKGEAIDLQGEKSDVKLEIKEGCPKGTYLMEVRTDLSSFGSVIPDDECFISPVVGVLAPAETSTSSYTLRIPHCLDEDDDISKVKVRMIHENRNPAVVEVPVRAKCTDGVLFYDIDSNFIELHTPHFSTIICTICQTPLHCLNTLANSWFARFDTQYLQENLTTQYLQENLMQKITSFLKGLIQKTPVPVQHDVEMRLYFCGVLHTIVDFRKVNIICLTSVTRAKPNEKMAFPAYILHSA